MRAQLLLVVLPIVAQPLRAQTTVGGVITADTDWSLAGSPYQFTATVTVTGGATLRIDPGVEVQLSAGQSLFIGDGNSGAGALVARGTQAQPVRFTSTAGAPGSWDSIRFTDHALDTQFDSAGAYVSGSVLQQCIVEYGNESNVYGAVSTEYCSLLVEHCVFRANRGVALQAYALGSQVEALRAEASRFFENHQAVTITGGSGNRLNECSFRNHSVPPGRAAVAISNAPNSLISGCVLQGNVGGLASLQLSGSSSASHVEHCEFLDNVHLTGALAASSSPVTISHTAFERNSATSTGLISGGAISLSSSSPSQIEHCRFDSNTALGAGAMNAFATNGTLRNSHFAGNTSQTSGGAIRSIQSPLTLENVNLESNSALNLGGAISASGQSLTLTRCAVVANTSGTSGGGVHSATALTLFETEISCNSAPLGGGLDLVTLPISIRGDPVAGRFNVVRGNVAARGSAIYCRVPSSSGPVDTSYVCWGVADPHADPNMIWDALDEPLVAQVLAAPVANCPPSDCQCAPTSYCTSSPNSTGAAANIGYSGSTSAAANDLTLTVAGCPPGVVGGFYFGPWRSASPLGAGTRCIDGGRTSLGAVLVSAAGDVALPLDLLSAPLLGVLTVGSTLNFQFWYRDPASPVAGVNLSDALSVTLCE